MQYQHKEGQIDQWNIIENLDTDKQIYRKLNFDRGTKWKFHGESIVFSKFGARTSGYLHRKIKTAVHTLYHILTLTQNGTQI